MTFALTNYNLTNSDVSSFKRVIVREIGKIIIHNEGKWSDKQNETFIFNITLIEGNGDRKQWELYNTKSLTTV